MKKWFMISFLSMVLLASSHTASAQCSLCTRTAQQLGEKPAKALNGGIIYLAFTPLMLAGFIGYRWWRNNREPLGEEKN